MFSWSCQQLVVEADILCSYSSSWRTVTILSGFLILPQVVSHCPEGMPPTIVAPLLSPQSIRFLSEEASAEEDELWQTLGDAWNIPRLLLLSIVNRHRSNGFLHQV